MFWPGESHGIVHGVVESDRTEWLSQILISCHINYAHFNVLQSYFLRFILLLLPTLLFVNLFSLGGLLIWFILVYICIVSHCCQCFLERNPNTCAQGVVRLQKFFTTSEHKGLTDCFYNRSSEEQPILLLRIGARTKVFLNKEEIWLNLRKCPKTEFKKEREKEV